MYLIENFKKDKTLPEELKNELFLFKEIMDEHLKFSFYELINLKFFLETKAGKSFFSFQVDDFKFIKQTNLKEDLDVQEHFKQFQENRSDILEGVFNKLLTKIEQSYLNRLKNNKEEFSCVNILKQAISDNIMTRNLINFNIVFNFFKEHFSFIHCVFIKKDLNSFSTNKKCLLRVQYYFDFDRIDAFKNVLLKQNGDMLQIFNFVDQTYFKPYQQNKNLYFIIPALKNLFSNDVSILKFLFFKISNDKTAFKCSKTLKIEKEYRTDQVIVFNSIFFKNVTFHPFSLIEGLNYKEYQPEKIDLALYIFIHFFNKINNQEVPLVSKEAFLNIFKFIDLFGFDACFLMDQQKNLIQVFENFLKYNLLNVDLLELKNHIRLLHQPFKKEPSKERKQFVPEVSFLNSLMAFHGPVQLFLDRRKFLILYSIYHLDMYVFSHLDCYDLKALKNFHKIASYN